MAKVSDQSLQKDVGATIPEPSDQLKTTLPNLAEGELLAQLAERIEYSGPPTRRGIRPMSVTIRKPGTSSSTVNFTTYDLPDYMGDGKKITSAMVIGVLKYDRSRPGELVGQDPGDIEKYRHWLETEGYRFNCFGFAVGSQIGDGKTPIGWLQPDAKGSFFKALETEFFPAYKHSIQRNANYNNWLDGMFRDRNQREGDLILFRKGNSPIHAAIAVKDNGVGYLIHKPGQQPLM